MAWTSSQSISTSKPRSKIRRNTSLLEEAAGRPADWVDQPAGHLQPASPLSCAEGYQWHGDCNDDDLPAILEFADGGRTRSILRSLTMDLNDLPHSTATAVG